MVEREKSIEYSNLIFFYARSLDVVRKMYRASMNENLFVGYLEFIDKGGWVGCVQLTYPNMK